MVVNAELIALLTSGIVIFLGLVISSLRQRKKINLMERLNVSYEQAAMRQAAEEIRIEGERSGRNSSLSWLEKKKRELEQSGTDITLPVYLTILVVTSVLIFFVVYKIIGIVFFALPFSLLGFLVPEKLVQRRKEKNIKYFNDEMVKALRLMASSMRAGNSLRQALEDVTRSKAMPTVIRLEFNKVLADVEYGMMVEDALYRLYERTGSEDVRFLAIAIETQRQLGGNIAETLDAIAATINNRRMLESEVKATMSQINATSNILSVLPFCMAGLIYLMNPTYFDPLFEDLTGRFLFLGCFISVCIGVFIIKRMSKIKV